MSFEKNVFINCPFDKEYKPILRALFFCLTSLELEPRVCETHNSSDTRISRIKHLIETSKYSIHDLSRMTVETKGQLARFNMPFELGFDYGCKWYGNDLCKTKSFLILDSHHGRYRKALSDLSGNDIAYHNNKEEDTIKAVRNWVYHFKSGIASGPQIWFAYSEFKADFQLNCLNMKYTDQDVLHMSMTEYKSFVKEWLKVRKK